MCAQILHLDVDAFAVSVARLADPALRHRPVVIGHDAGGRGTVVCPSYEARARRISAGMPLPVAKRRLPEAVYLPDDAFEYERQSTRLLEIFRASAMTVEAATLDDFYLDLTGCEKLFGGSLARWGGKLKRMVEGETGLPLTLGLASNKMLARIATSLAKTGHLLEVFPGSEADFIRGVGVEMLPGVGDATRRRLREFGVRRAGQICTMGEETLKLVFGSAGEELWHRARGEFHEPVKPTLLHRFITHEHLFSEDVADGGVLESAASLLAQRLAADLRRNLVRCHRAEMMLVYTDGMQATHSVRIAYPTDQDFQLIVPARKAASAAFGRRVRVRRMILKASFIPHSDGQFDIFEERHQQRRRSLYRAIDEVRAKHGFDAVRSARSVAVPGQPC
jgi:DNA polymerase IV